MHVTLTTLIDRLASPAIADTDVIQWSCPVPSFGDLSRARVASVGINPSNREFVDEAGKELAGTGRRFHTLTSLAIPSWTEADSRHIRRIIGSCQSYFSRNPYDRWFRRLDQVIVGAHASFYDSRGSACHLDLIPYATRQKWTQLNYSQRRELLEINADTLGLLMRDSEVDVLILNGRSVTDHFQEVSGTRLKSRKMPSWSLPRRTAKSVMGLSYSGETEKIAGIDLGRRVIVLGFNHNLQSSFGVTNEVVDGIRKWVSRTLGKYGR